MIFLKTNTWKYDIFFKCSERMVFPKKSHCNMIFLLSSGKMAFLFPKNVIFFPRTETKRWSFSKNTWKYDDFCILGKDGISFSYKCEITLLSKRQRWSFPKNTPKDDTCGITKKDNIHSRKCDISILDWHSRKSSNDSMYFYEDLSKCFHILSSSEKSPENFLYRIEIWLYLKVIWLEIFYNKESSITCTVQLSGVVFRGVLECQLRKIYVH